MPEYMYTVNVNNTTGAVFDKAEEAVQYAMHYGFSPMYPEEVVAKLRRGEIVIEGYGVGQTQIYPIAKRATSGIARHEDKNYWSPTMDLRHVFREVNDGNRDFKVLALQQRWQGRRHESEWRDVEVSRNG